MGKYILRSVPNDTRKHVLAVFTAHRWWRNGDHPDDASEVISTTEEVSELFLTEGAIVRRFRHPEIPGTDLCSLCNHTMHEHGWIDRGEEGITVCPGVWIVQAGNEPHIVLTDRDLHATLVALS